MPDLAQLALTPLDIAVVVVIVLSGVFALFRGLIVEVLSVVAWVGAALVFLYLFPLARPYGREVISFTPLADGITGVVVFLGSLIGFSLIGRLLARAVHGGSVNWIDRLLGFVFGLARGVFVLGVLLLGFNQFVPPSQHPAWLKNSRSEPIIAWTARTLEGLLPRLEGQFDDGRDSAETNRYNQPAGPRDLRRGER
ncbi:MAG: CvpA family protein [Alphaproteobacteria bacterium]|nr:CvpA family protein [Alphaproteobacteria bacterium]